MVGVWETSKNQLSLRGIVIAAGCLPSHIFFNTSNPSSVFMNARLSTRPVTTTKTPTPDIISNWTNACIIGRRRIDAWRSNHKEKPSLKRWIFLTFLHFDIKTMEREADGEKSRLQCSNEPIDSNIHIYLCVLLRCNRTNKRYTYQ